MDRALRVGMGMDRINAILIREPDHKWSAQEVLILRAVDDLMTGRMINPETRANLERLDRRESPQLRRQRQSIS